MRRFRFALEPRWVVIHLLLVAACVVMVLLGRWQWHVAHVRHGDIRNYAYSFQWWAFTVFALLMWARILRDAADPRRRQDDVPEEADEAVAYRRYVMPQHSTSGPVAGDAELARYNAYLDALERGSEPPGESR